MFILWIILGLVIGALGTFIILSTVMEHWHRQYILYRIRLTMPYAFYKGVNIQEDGVRCKMIDERE